jgi:hypothetical protein
MSRAFLAIAGAVFAVVLLAVGAAPASAAPCERGLLGAGPSAWEADEDDGEFDNALLFARGGPFALRDDAFDGYGQVEIDGNPYENPNEGGCRYSKRKDEVTFPATQVINGISVKPQLYVSKRKPLGRQLVSLRNLTDSPLTIEFAWDGEVGAFTPGIGATSNGNATMDAADRWATSCDDDDDDGCANTAGEAGRGPDLAHNWEGKGGKHSADTVLDLDDGDELRFQFDDVKIGAGKTVTFMQIVSLARSVKSANKAARAIDKNPKRAGAFAKLSKREVQRLQNWKKPRRR